MEKKKGEEKQRQQVMNGRCFGWHSVQLRVLVQKKVNVVWQIQ